MFCLKHSLARPLGCHPSQHNRTDTEYGSNELKGISGLDAGAAAREGVPERVLIEAGVLEDGARLRKARAAASVEKFIAEHDVVTRVRVVTAVYTLEGNGHGNATSQVEKGGEDIGDEGDQAWEGVEEQRHQADGGRNDTEGTGKGAKAGLWRYRSDFLVFCCRDGKAEDDRTTEEQEAAEDGGSDG